MTSLDLCDSIPQTILSGTIKSFTAVPSRRNSGFETISKSVFHSDSIISLQNLPVPTGTVDLLIKTWYLFEYFPNVFATCCTYWRSALWFLSGGVPTALKIASQKIIPCC